MCKSRTISAPRPQKSPRMCRTISAQSRHSVCTFLHKLCDSCRRTLFSAHFGANVCTILQMCTHCTENTRQGYEHTGHVFCVSAHVFISAHGTRFCAHNIYINCAVLYFVLWLLALRLRAEQQRGDEWGTNFCVCTFLHKFCAQVLLNKCFFNAHNFFFIVKLRTHKMFSNCAHADLCRNVKFCRSCAQINLNSYKNNLFSIIKINSNIRIKNKIMAQNI